MPGPATLPEAHKLAERLSVRRNRENLKALEALREHCKFVEKSRAYADAVAAVCPPSPPSNTSGIVEIPDHIDHMPPTSYRPKGKIMQVGLPKVGDYKGKGKQKEMTDRKSVV